MGIAKGLLRLCVDARPLLYNGGITRYTAEMIKALSQCEDIELVLIGHRDFSFPLAHNMVKVVDKKFSFLPGSLWFFLRAPYLAKRYGCDVLWGTQHILPRKSASLSYVVTWHDVVWKVLPASMKITNRLVNHLFASHSIKIAQKILCVSYTTEQDLLHYYPEAKGKTYVIYEGKSLPDISSAICSLSFPFLFALGSLEPRKNILALIRAFEHLVRMPGYETFRLVITGSQGWKNASLFRHMKTSPAKDRIIFTGYLQDEEIIAYMKKCALFVFPSLYEGFGLPLLEAEAKCPVVANTIAVFRELENMFENLYFCDFSLSFQDIAKNISLILESFPQKLRFSEQGKKTCHWKYAASAFLTITRDLS